MKAALREKGFSTYNADIEGELNRNMEELVIASQ